MFEFEARRKFLQNGAGVIGGLLASDGLSSIVYAKNSDSSQSPAQPPKGFRTLFNGTNLSGWQPRPRLPMPLFPGGPERKVSAERLERVKAHTGKWAIEDGAIIGAQNPHGSGLGGYLVSEEKFGDFELLIDARPDWRVDTGILVRALAAGNVGYQVLVDHRPHGGLGGVFGNGLANLHGMPFAIDVKRDATGKPIGLVPADPNDKRSEISDKKRELLNYAADVDDFIAAWKFGDWNTFKIRCTGRHPRITTWINDLKIAELDTGSITWPNYDAESVAKALGRRGHIVLEIHSTSSRDRIGQERWWPGTVCRWRNIFVREWKQS
jgi:3-keto-disaccharide hydrolase